MGEKAGLPNVTVLSTEMGGHSHSLAATTVVGTAPTLQGNLLAQAQQSSGGRPPVVNKGNIYNATAPGTALAPTSVSLSGSSLPHNNVQPSLTLRYCIAINGVFPSRG